MKFFYLLFLIALMVPRCSEAANIHLMNQIMMCESSMRPNVWGDDGKSYGIAQFRKETFYEFAHMAHIYRPNWFNTDQQIYLLAWGLDHGYAKRWTCYRKIHKKNLTKGRKYGKLEVYMKRK